jgi:hypothetical protein
MLWNCSLDVEARAFRAPLYVGNQASEAQTISVSSTLGGGKAIRSLFRQMDTIPKNFGVSIIDLPEIFHLTK